MGYFGNIQVNYQHTFCPCVSLVHDIFYQSAIISTKKLRFSDILKKFLFVDLDFGFGLQRIWHLVIMQSSLWYVLLGHCLKIVRWKKGNVGGIIFIRWKKIRRENMGCNIYKTNTENRNLRVGLSSLATTYLSHLLWVQTKVNWIRA